LIEISNLRMPFKGIYIYFKKGVDSMELATELLSQVSGGSAALKIIEAATAASTLYTGVAGLLDDSKDEIGNATRVYNALGHKIGEQCFDLAYPDPLGKMVYIPEDFKKNR
jgi:hypothetical protein